MTRRVIYRRAVLSSAATLAGCSVLPARPYEVQRAWPLEIRRPVLLPSDPHGPVLLVRGLRAGPGLDSRGLQLLADDGSVVTDFYEEWAVSPALGVEVSLRSWLSACGVFSAVVAPGSLATADYSLEGELSAFLTRKSEMRSDVTLNLVLFRAIAARQTPVLQQSFTTFASTRGLDPAERVASLTTALANDFAAIEAGLRASIVQSRSMRER